MLQHFDNHHDNPNQLNADAALVAQKSREKTDNSKKFKTTAVKLFSKSVQIKGKHAHLIRAHRTGFMSTSALHVQMQSSDQ